MTSKDGWDEASRLAARAAAGDQDALGQIVVLTQRDLWRYIAFHAGPGEADDLVQDTYLRAIGTLAAFEGRSSLRTWLLVIARRVVIDHLRRRAARPHVVSTDNWQDLADAAPNPHTDFTELVELDLLLAGLSTERREALILTQVLGLSYVEAGDICGCPVGTIRSRVARAREDLVRLAADEPDGRAANH